MTAGEDYMMEIETNLVENRQVVDANQGHANTHSFVPSNQSWSLTNNSVAPLQSSHPMVYGSTENGRSTIGYHSEHQRATTISGEAPNGTNNPLYAPATSYVPPSQQEYTGHPTYPSTGSYGYGSSEYQNQYCGYQPPANDSSHQHMGAGPNTGAPYQSLSSFQNAIPYVGPTSYSDTYYNHGDYQTSGYQTALVYQSNSYSNQSTSWNGGIGGNVPHEYSNYTSSDSTGAHNVTTAAGNPLHYQQQYGQWAGYYGQSTSSNVLCAPGTENLPVINNKNIGNQTLNTSSGHPYANNQPPPPGTSSWRQDFTPPALPASQGKKDDAGYNQSSGWKAGEHAFQNQHDNQTTSYCQTALDSNHSSHSHSDDQQRALHSQSSNLQFPLTNQVSQNFQTSSQTTTAPDTCQTSKMQILTNPRIAPTLVVGVQKADKETVSTRAIMKPTYISVAVPKLHNNVAALKLHNIVATQDYGDNPKGILPTSLRTYVERTFARCKDDSQRTVNQDIMKDIITKASADGTLLTRNWDTEPLFPMPKTTLGNSERKSPKRRVKSRWEPLPEEKLADGLRLANHTSTKEVSQDLTKDNKKVGSAQTSNGKNNSWYKMKFVHAQQQSLSINNTVSPLKRQRFDVSNSDENGHASSDSDIEQSLTKYHSSAITLANSPEERKKRENRVRRFEKRQNHQSESTSTKSAGAASIYTRRTNVQFLAKNHEDNANRAVEDIDWDSLTIKGTCQEIAKHYLRLTSAPDPATVRPVDVLEKALLMVKSSQKNYLYKCDQLKSVRQDLTVQRIQNELTVKVYETHARLALEAGDLSEYNQCQSQLKRLYSEGIEGCRLEFYAYNLLCVILHSSNNRELLLSMARLSANAKEDVAVKHALAVRAAVTSNNYVIFFRLYKKAPNLNTCLMDLYVEKVRVEAIRCMCKSYRPGIPISYIARVLGFSKMDLPEDCKESKDMHGLEECDDWLRAHGAILTSDNKGEVQLDTKASSSTLYMPEPEDAVAHGDATLAVGDFLTRTS